MFKYLFLSFSIAIQPLVDDEVLEPSVQNEVDHALNTSPTNSPVNSAACVAFIELYRTNGLTATDAAIDLVSRQKSDGRWFCETNDVTWAAREILKRLSGLTGAAEGQ